MAEATRSSDSAADAVDREPRCWRCGKKLAVFLTRPWRIECVRCKARNASPPAGDGQG
jgi:hypothetical protein